MKYRTVLLGILTTPLPMVLGILVTMAAFGGRMDAYLVLFATVVTSVAIWVLILISKGILHFTPWRSRRAHLTVMFVTTMIPQLLWNEVEFETDTSFSYQVNDQTVQTYDFALGGIVAMALVALMSAMCMWIFWHFFVRDREAHTPSE